MKGRILAGALGLFALAAALGGDVSLPLSPFIDRLGSDYVLVALVAALGLLLAIPLLAGGRTANLNHGETPTPERQATAPSAGVDLDDHRTSLRLLVPVVGASGRRTLRQRLQRAAAGVVARTRGCTRDTAHERVTTGEWSSDPVASAFLAEGDRLPPATYLRAVARAEHPYSYATRRTARQMQILEEGSS